MNSFDKVMKDAEHHLEFSEKHAKDLHRRIQQITAEIQEVERNARITTESIQASERKLEILASKQSDTRKKLSDLYCELVALPAASSLQNTDHTEEKSAGALVHDGFDQNAVVESVMYRVCILNSLASTDDADTLTKQVHQTCHILRRSNDSEDNYVGVAENETSVVQHDAVAPLCIYDLLGNCSDKNCCHQHVNGTDSLTIKSATTGRSWRSLKFKEYLKQSILFDTLEMHEQNHNGSNGSSSVSSCFLGDRQTEDKARKRYFDAMVELGCDASEVGEKGDEEKGFSHFSNVSPAVSLVDAVLNSSVWLWSHCQLELACCCIYSCLGISFADLPFGILFDKAVLNSYFSSFLGHNLNKLEIEILYATLVYILVSGEHIGKDILERLRYGSDKLVVRGDTSFLFYISPSRRRDSLSGLSRLETHSPECFKKLWTLVGNAHSAMNTGLKIFVGDSDVIFDSSGVSSIKNSEPSSMHWSLTHDILWQCTCLLQEATSTNKSNGYASFAACLCRNGPIPTSARVSFSDVPLSLSFMKLFQACFPSTAYINTLSSNPCDAVATITAGYLRRRVSFEAYVDCFLRSCSGGNSSQISNGKSVVFSHKETYWKIFLCSDADSQEYIIGEGNYQITFLPIESESDYSVSSDEDDKSATGEVDNTHALDDIDLRDMLTQAFVNFVDIKVHVDANASIDSCTLLGIWLCLGNSCSYFDPMSKEFAKYGSMNRSTAVQDFFSSLLIRCRQSGSDIGSLVMQFLLAYNRQYAGFVSRIADSTVDKLVQSHLRLVVAVLLAASLIRFDRSTTMHCSSQALPNIFQITLLFILRDLREIKLLSISHVDYIFGDIIMGNCCIKVSTSGRKSSSQRFEESCLSIYYQLYPVLDQSIRNSCLASLLSADVIDICTSMLQNEKQNEFLNRSFVIGRENERHCLRWSSGLMRVMQVRISKILPKTLHSFILVLFAAEQFEAVVVAIRALLEMRHPFSSYYIGCTICQCFESESMSYKLRLMSRLLKGKSASRHSEGIEYLNIPLDRVGSPGTTFMREGMALCDILSPQHLEYFSGFFASCRDGKTCPKGGASFELNNYTTSGLLPATFSALVGHDPAISSVCLSGNGYTSFPLPVLDVSSITQLDLSWNKLSYLPSNLDSLSRLQVLNISHNAFSYFPAPVLKLENSLTELYLQDNQIQKIGNDILRLHKLEVFDIRNNMLRMIPARLSSHTNLKFFRSSGNIILENNQSRVKSRKNISLRKNKRSLSFNVFKNSKSSRKLY